MCIGVECVFENTVVGYSILQLSIRSSGFIVLLQVSFFKYLFIFGGARSSLYCVGFSLWWLVL